MMYIFAKNRVWLLRGLVNHEMSCLRLESEHQNNAVLEGECQQSSHFCQIQLYQSWELQQLSSLLCLVMTPKIFLAKLEYDTCLLFHFQNEFFPYSLKSSHIPSSTLFHPFVCQLLLFNNIILVGVKTKQRDSYAGLALQNTQQRGLKSSQLFR